MFARCPLRVRVAAVRLDILTTVKSVQTSHVPRLTILLVVIIQTSIDVDSSANIPNITVDIVGQSSNTGTICCITLTRCSGRKFACAQCQRSYVSKGGLRKHVNKMHKKLTTYRCETCGKGFFDRCLYQDHIAAHTGVKRHTCSICEM